MSMTGIDFCEVVTFVNEPEPRISQAGGAWMTCRAAYNPRVKNRQTNAYEDGETTWIGLKAFKQTSDMIVATFHKGDKALVKGTLTTVRYTDNTGAERESLVLVVDEIGASPRFATVTITRNKGTGGAQQPQGGGWTSGTGPEFIPARVRRSWRIWGASRIGLPRRTVLDPATHHSRSTIRRGASSLEGQVHGGSFCSGSGCAHQKS